MKDIPCDFCQAWEREELFPGEPPNETNDPRIRVVQCKQCSLVYSTPRLDSTELENLYGPERYGVNRSRFGWTLEQILRVFRRWRARRVAISARRPGRLLEIGCARGVFLKEMSRLGWEVVGTEISPTVIREGAHRLGVWLSVQDAGRLAFNDATFDAVVMYHVLEHLPSADEALSDIARVLKPGGLLLVTVPNIGTPWIKFFRRSFFGLGIPEHTFYFSRHTLKAYLDRYGFRPVKEKRFTLEHDPYMMLQSLLNRLDRNDDYLFRLLQPRLRPRAGRFRLAATLLALVPLVPVSFLLCLLGGLWKQPMTIDLLCVKQSE